jgi:hypothetical protein
LEIYPEIDNLLSANGIFMCSAVFKVNELLPAILKNMTKYTNSSVQKTARKIIKKKKVGR